MVVGYINTGTLFKAFYYSAPYCQGFSGPAFLQHTVDKSQSIKERTPPNFGCEGLYHTCIKSRILGTIFPKKKNGSWGLIFSKHTVLGIKIRGEIKPSRVTFFHDSKVDNFVMK